VTKAEYLAETAKWGDQWAAGLPAKDPGAIGTTLMGRMVMAREPVQAGQMGREVLHTVPTASQARLDLSRTWRMPATGMHD
jgi:hypothetical protein